MNKMRWGAAALFILGAIGILTGFPAALSGQRSPVKMSFVGSALWTRAQDIKIKDGLAYCAFQNGLGIVDISDIKKPALLSKLYVGGGYAVAVRDGLAYLAAGGKGLAVIDVADPKSPTLKGILATGGEARDIVLSGPIAFVANGPAGLLAADVRNPEVLKIAATLSSPGEATGLALQGDLLYLADGSAGLQIVDVKDPAEPKALGALDTDGTAESVAVSGRYAFIADGASGLKVIDVSKLYCTSSFLCVITGLFFVNEFFIAVNKLMKLIYPCCRIRK